ncbi:hypothetical protein [Abyssicoccus albus]|uniref:Uncharacterized protein n=1 Tax=Abyssicoccus albus TaxID=1817405 RepID=A0A3N5C5Q2_9BACL|nr:hypothetical protein [Abyssicoccus albus]RPF57618.1 hypothetical protein EDD62_0239 [Abyssicoccus albus]
MNLYITEVKIKDGQFYGYTEESIEGYEATGRMIVDSDQHSFIYLLDNGKSFDNLHFVQETWGMLHESFEKHPIIINDTLELIEFKDEMNDLLWNIKGNDNYGKDFHEAVEETFKLKDE